MIYHKIYLLVILLGSLLLTSCAQSNYQIDTLTEQDIYLDEYVNGTLLLPPAKQKPPICVIVAGSGPTDRNGNNSQMTNNSLKMLAEGLADRGVASLRYDKRGIAKSRVPGLTESGMSFEMLARDITSWCQLLSEQDRFSSITLIGHSEGSLLSMLAAQECGDRFVSLAGPGRSAPDVIIDQLEQRAPILVPESRRIMDSLMIGVTVDSVHFFLQNLFRPSVQPYLITYFKYDPSIEIKKLTVPILIINGDKDIQVGVSDAELLHEARPDAGYHIITDMNHVLKPIKEEDGPMANMNSYNQPDLPISPELITIIADFIKE